jgi:hypothetical protein
MCNDSTVTTTLNLRCWMNHGDHGTKLQISDGKEFKEKLLFMINELGSMHCAWNASRNGDDQQNCSASDIDDSESTPEGSISSLQGGNRLSFCVHCQLPSFCDVLKTQRGPRPQQRMKS